MLLWAGLVLIGISVFIVMQTVFLDEGEYQASEKLEVSANAKNEFAKHGFVLKYSRPFFKRYVTPIVSEMKSKKKFKEKYKRKLASAGLINILTPEDFYAFKLFLIIGFPVAFLALRTLLSETWPLSYAPVLGVLGYFYPDIWVKGKIQKRQKDIIIAMPFCVDMLALCVEAGLDFIAAMARVIEKAEKSPLVDEFETVLKEIKIGASRAEALRNMSWRVDMIQMSSFTATLIAADSVGANISPILKALSIEIRQKKSSEVEKAAAKATTKILVPMIFFIVPAVFLIIIGPLILQFMGGQ